MMRPLRRKGPSADVHWDKNVVLCDILFRRPPEDPPDGVGDADCAARARTLVV